MHDVIPFVIASLTTHADTKFGRIVGHRRDRSRVALNLAARGACHWVLPIGVEHGSSHTTGSRVSVNRPVVNINRIAHRAGFALRRIERAANSASVRGRKQTARKPEETPIVSGLSLRSARCRAEMMEARQLARPTAAGAVAVSCDTDQR